jgi:hypothetical protein
VLRELDIPIEEAITVRALLALDDDGCTHAHPTPPRRLAHLTPAAGATPTRTEHPTDPAGPLRCVSSLRGGALLLVVVVVVDADDVVAGGGGIGDAEPCVDRVQVAGGERDRCRHIEIRVGQLSHDAATRQ